MRAPVEVRLGNSTALEVTIANFGDGGLEIDSIDLLAPEESGFVLDPSERARCEQIVIDPQDACRLVIQFTPRQPGTAEATLLALAGDDEQTVVLTGVGFTGPVLELEGVGEFGNQLVDTTSDREFVVRNAGDRPLAVGRIVIRGESTRAFPMRGESSCLGALDPGTDCGFVVGFRPAERTAYVAELVIEWEEGDAVLAISGTGIVEGSIGFEEFGGEFGDVTVGEFADGVVLATNGGDTTISPLGLDLAGGGFRLEDTDCAESLPPGAACGILIRFQPAEPGSYQGAVAVGGVQLPLSGRGVEGVAVLSPVDPGGFYVLPVGVFPNLEFIFVQYDFQVDLLEGTEDFVNEPREVVITNTGEGLLRLGKIAFESPQQEFILQANACSSATLAPGEVCTFELVFAPTSPGEKEAFIAIEYEQGRGPLRGRIIGVAYSYVG
jgi:hypothetical protein